MWFIFIAACLFIGGLLTPESRDPQCGHRVALVNSLIRAAGLTPAWRQLRWRTRPQAQRLRAGGVAVSTPAQGEGAGCAGLHGGQHSP